VCVYWCTECGGLGAGGAVMRSFLNEALTMRDFRHVHVLRLIGIVLDCAGDAAAASPPLVILPFMTHGDLLSYIRHQHNVCTSIH